MSINVTTLRKNIYKILDEVLESGKPLEINRNGRILKIIPGKEVDIFKNVKKRSGLKCDPDDLIHIDWSKEWKPFI